MRRQNNKKMEQEAYRHVPYDIDVEQALLGAILADNQVVERISSILKAEDFYDPLHQRLFEVMLNAADRGNMVLTPLTVHAIMKADPGLMEVGGHAYLAGHPEGGARHPERARSARLHDLRCLTR